MVDEGTARDFQERYLGGERGALAGLYAECRHITSSLAKAYCYRFGIQISDERMVDTIQLVLSRVLSRYRNPEYKIRSFRRVLGDEVVHELSNHKGPKASFLKAMVSLESIPEPPSLEEAPANGNHLAYFNDIYTEPKGPQIIITLSRSRSFRSAMVAVEAIRGREFCYRFAVQLRYIYLHVDHGKKAKAMQPGRNGSGGDGKTVGLDKRRSKEGKQAQFFSSRREDAHHVEPHSVNGKT